VNKARTHALLLFSTLFLAMLLSCGCVTTDKGRSGRSTLGLAIPGVGSIEGGSNAPPQAGVGSSFYAEKIEITGTAAEIFAVILAGGTPNDLLTPKVKETTDERPDSPTPSE